MDYSDRLLKNYEPEIIGCYKDLQKSGDLKLYSIYLTGGQVVKIEAYGYRYEVQSFVALSGEWSKDKSVGLISFFVKRINKKGKTGKQKTYDLHFFKFEDVSAIVREVI